jgi:outer membrane immunogenic protein
MKGPPMRWLMCALVLLGIAPRAFAADLDLPPIAPPPSWLPVGPATFTRWSGFYVGGQFGYSSVTADFTKATRPLVAQSLTQTQLESIFMPSEWEVLGRESSHTSGFGGFAGYNTQWQDLVLGIEANYTHSPANVVATDSPIMDRIVTVGSALYSVNLQGSGTLSVTDYGSLRARAGWVLGDFLPYGFAGLALGRGDYAVTSLIHGQISNDIPPILPCPIITSTCFPYSFANSAAQNGVLLYGFSVGGGFDWALTSNIFVRAEYEYIQFAQIANITSSISTARVGAGFKF